MALNPRVKKVLRPVLAVAVIGVVGYFFARSLADNWTEISQRDLHFGWWVVGAVAAFVLAVAYSGLLWGSVMGTLDGRAVRRWEAVRVQNAAWLMKYVPGQVGTVVYKVVWAQQDGRSRTVALISVVYENAFLLLGSIVPMLAILLVAQAGDTEVSSVVWMALAAMIPLAFVLHPRVFHAIINRLGRRRLGGDLPREYVLSGGRTWLFQLHYLVPRVINGAGVIIIAANMIGVGVSSWIPLIAAYAIAGAVGIMAVFVPSGLGVRESVFVLFATPYLGVDGAIVVALVARVLATLGDGVIGAGYGALTLAKRRAERTS